jgi:hypothetical protein
MAECLVAEFRPGAADQHDIHRRIGFAGQRDSGQVSTDVATVE